MILYNWYNLKKNIDGKYTELESNHIIFTLISLQKRIGERFPNSGLSSVCSECVKVGSEIEDLLHKIDRPVWFMRFLIFLTSALLLSLVLGFFIYLYQQSSEINGWLDIIQATEAGVNDLIFLSLALWFVLNLETKVKRKAVLVSLHRLRSIAHVVDMHQLTKDPAHLLASHGDLSTNDTESSPARSMTHYQLSRYLNYCSELLSLISKLAALHAQKENDAVVLEAVNDIELLATGLSSKIWQKLSMLEDELLKD
jgi:hypothetical protein